MSTSPMIFLAERLKGLFRWWPRRKRGKCRWEQIHDFNGWSDTLAQSCRNPRRGDVSICIGPNCPDHEPDITDCYGKKKQEPNGTSTAFRYMADYFKEHEQEIVERQVRRLKGQVTEREHRE